MSLYASFTPIPHGNLAQAGRAWRTAFSIGSAAAGQFSAHFVRPNCGIPSGPPLGKGAHWENRASAQRSHSIFSLPHQPVFLKANLSRFFLKESGVRKEKDIPNLARPCASHFGGPQAPDPLYSVKRTKGLGV